ncbi:MAG TPA: hypothetical protein VKA60_21110 [Blastocatellia bacterium]|nr:hypothetical protein [Blastocatellia bacterium]
MAKRGVLTLTCFLLGTCLIVSAQSLVMLLLLGLDWVRVSITGPEDIGGLMNDFRPLLSAPDGPLRFLLFLVAALSLFLLSLPLFNAATQRLYANSVKAEGPLHHS